MLQLTNSLQCGPQEIREIQLTNTVLVPRDIPAWPWGAGGNCTAAPGAADTAWRGGRAAGAGGREAVSGTWTAAGPASSCSPGCRRAAPGRSTASPAPGLGWATVDCSWRRWSWHASGSRDCEQAQNCSSVTRKAVWWRISQLCTLQQWFVLLNQLTQKIHESLWKEPIPQKHWLSLIQIQYSNYLRVDSWQSLNIIFIMCIGISILFLVKYRQKK